MLADRFSDPDCVHPDIVIVIRRYYEQLEEEREYRHDFRLTPTAGGTYEAKEGLLAQGPGHWIGATAAESLDIARILDAIAESARSGGPVTLAPPEGPRP